MLPVEAVLIAATAVVVAAVPALAPRVVALVDGSVVGIACTSATPSRPGAGGITRAIPGSRCAAATARAASAFGATIWSGPLEPAPKAFWTAS